MSDTEQSAVQHAPTQSQPKHSLTVVWSHAGPDTAVGSATRRLEIPAGQSASFEITGRSEVRIADQPSAVGRIDAAGRHWSMSNFTSGLTFAIENMEGGAELIKVPPRRLSIVVPFEISRVLVPSDVGVTELKIFGAPPVLFQDPGAHQSENSPPYRLNEQSKYFLVLVALCEPRLRKSPMAAVPSVQEVVERLRPVAGFEQVNRSSVNYHIDYLREHKLLLDDWAVSTRGGRMHSKREALVSFALRHDLVREEHIQLLSPQDAH